MKRKLSELIRNSCRFSAPFVSALILVFGVSSFAQAEDEDADDAELPEVAAPIADEAKADEAKADEAKADEAKADEAKADEAKADEANADETKADETKADEAKAETSAPVSPDFAEVTTAETDRRVNVSQKVMALIKDAEDFAAEAEQLWKENKPASLKFDASIAAFQKANEAISNLGHSPITTELRTVCTDHRKGIQRSYGQYLFQMATEKFMQATRNQDDLTFVDELKKVLDLSNSALGMYYLGIPPGTRAVEEVLNRAQALDPEFSQKVAILLKKAKKNIEAFEFYDKTRLKTIDPNFENRQHDIAKLYRSAENLYREKLYTDSRDKCEQILILDPFNDKAIRLLEKIYRRLYFYAEQRLYNEFMREQAQTEWLWQDNIPRSERIVPKPLPRVHNTGRSDLYERMKSIVIDSFGLDGADINSAVTYLRRKSAEIDPSGVPINIVSRVTPEEANKTPITIQLDRVPLFDVVRYICQKGGYAYRIKDDVLVIGEDNIEDNLEMRHIPIRFAVIQQLTGNDAENTPDNTFGEDSALTIDSIFDTEGIGKRKDRRKDKITADALRKYFQEYGINFPEGATVAYDRKANKLTVRNTPENLRELELLIRDIDVKNPMVLMESKIVEVKMNDLEQLGFDWLLTHENSSDNWSFSVGTPVRNLNASETPNIMINNMNILPNFGGGSVWSLYLTVYALDRTDRSEVLSTPKVIANTGETAKIKLVREMYFPESWEAPETTLSCSTISFTPSFPTFGEPTEVGIVFEATPTVSPNNYTIQLNLAPTVSDLIGWTDYSYDIVIGNFSTITDTSAKKENNKIKLIQPEISKRQITTNVKVYDGQTVVLGGMFIDRQANNNDKWPILGDLPLVGRLFTNATRQIEKSNLMISVTARLMSGDGVPIRSNVATGKPDFRR